MLSFRPEQRFAGRSSISHHFSHPSLKTSPAPLRFGGVQRGSLTTGDVFFSSQSRSDKLTTIPTPTSPCKAAQIAAANRALPLSDEERLARTTEQALALFARFENNKTGLLNYLRTEWGIDVQQDQSRPTDPKSWIKQTLEQYGADAVILFPRSLIYPGQQYAESEIHPSLVERWEAHPKQFKGLFKQWEAEGQIGILISNTYHHSGESIDYLVGHEIFHLLQFMNGLNFASPSLQTELQIDGFLCQLNNRFISRPLGGWHLEKRLRALADHQEFQLITSVHDGPGESVRSLMRRELETINFFKAHASRLGLSSKERFHNASIEPLYRIIAEASWALDAGPEAVEALLK